MYPTCKACRSEIYSRSLTQVTARPPISPGRSVGKLSPVHANRIIRPLPSKDSSAFVMRSAFHSSDIDRTVLGRNRVYLASLRSLASYPATEAGGIEAFAHSRLAYGYCRARCSDHKVRRTLCSPRDIRSTVCRLRPLNNPIRHARRLQRLPGPRHRAEHADSAHRKVDGRALHPSAGEKRVPKLHGIDREERQVYG